MTTRGHEGWDGGLADPIQVRAGLAGHAPAVRATDAVGNRFRERPVVDPRCARDAEELSQRVRVGVEAVREHGISDPLEAFDLRIAASHVVERRFDQGQGAHVLWPPSRGDQRPQHPVGVSDDVGTRGEKRKEISGIGLEKIDKYGAGILQVCNA